MSERDEFDEMAARLLLDIELADIATRGAGVDVLAAALRRVRDEERERCAKVCRDLASKLFEPGKNYDVQGSTMAEHCANLIAARSSAASGEARL